MAGSPRKDSKHYSGLRYKLVLAFAVMAIIPLMACAYLVINYVFPSNPNIFHVSIIMIIAVALSILGLGLAKALVDPLVDLAVEARLIASGEYDRKIMIASDDELEKLGDSINVMTNEIRSNLDELKTYSQKTKEIDFEIRKKVIGLASLLQISDLISSGSVELDSILELAIQKISSIFDTGYGVLYMDLARNGEFIMKSSYNMDEEKLLGLTLKEDADGIIEKVLQDHQTLVIDGSTKDSRAVNELKTECGIRNMVAIPLFSGKRNIGIFIVGNRAADFKFKPDDIDMIKVFAKQMTIAIENDFLMRRAEELAIIDDLTGLFNNNYIISRLEEEIKRAIFYQRPCSFIVINVDNFKAFREAKGEIPAEDVLKRMGKVIKENATPMGKVARISGDEFAILLPEKNKKEATAIAEEIRKKVESTNFSRDGKLHFTVSGGISENPIDGSTKDDLLKRAEEAVHKAKLAGKNRVSA